MGLAVATELIKRGSWTVHLLDLNVAAGAEVIKALGPQSHFHQVNIVRYEELSTAFDRVFCTENRLDFVYANAGIVERFNFYEKHDLSSTPPELDTRVVDINLTAVLTTCYLALHYFRKSPNEHRSLVATASCGGIYPTPQTAMYAGTKHGVVGFIRSIAPKYLQDDIRVNCICPGTVRTGLIEPEAWETFPQQYFTPIEVITDTVLKLVDGNDMIDASSHAVKAGELYGRAVEVICDNIYFREPPPFCDEAMALVLGATTKDEILKVDNSKT